MITKSEIKRTLQIMCKPWISKEIETTNENSIEFTNYCMVR